MRRRRPRLSAEDARHLTQRVDAWVNQADAGLGIEVVGLDYEEASESDDGEREWYPVERAGHLQRVAPEGLTRAERAWIDSEMERQSEERKALCSRYEARVQVPS